MASSHPPLLTADEAADYRIHRNERVERLGGTASDELDAQLTWWLIKEVFDRHPELEGFDTHDGIDPDDDDGRYRSLNDLQVAVFGVSNHAGSESDRARLLEAQKDIRDILIGYGLVSSDGLYELIETSGVIREELTQWDWGRFGADWIAQRTQRHLDQSLPASATAGPRPRL